MRVINNNKIEKTKITRYNSMNKIDIIKIKSLQITYIIVLSNIIIITALFFIKKSFLKESLFTFSIIWSFLFLFFMIGLYKGIRIINKKIDEKRKENNIKKEKSWIDEVFDVDFGIFLDEGIVGFIIGLCISFVVATLMIVIISFIFPVISEIGIFIITGINFAVARLFRKVLILRKKCRGNLFESLKYSFINSTLYTAVIFIVYAAITKIFK